MNNTKKENTTWVNPHPQIIGVDTQNKKVVKPSEKERKLYTINLVFFCLLLYTLNVTYTHTHTRTGRRNGEE